MHQVGFCLVLCPCPCDGLVMYQPRTPPLAPSEDRSEISDGRGRDLNESSRGRKLKDLAAITSRLDETLRKWITAKS